MGIDTHVPGSAGEGFSFPVWDVLFCLRISVLLGHAKIDDVDNIGGFGVRAADKKVVGLDVAVDEVLFVDRLDA